MRTQAGVADHCGVGLRLPAARLLAYAQRCRAECEQHPETPVDTVVGENAAREHADRRDHDAVCDRLEVGSPDRPKHRGSSPAGVETAHRKDRKQQQTDDSGFGEELKIRVVNGVRSVGDEVDAFERAHIANVVCCDNAEIVQPDPVHGMFLGDAPRNRPQIDPAAASAGRLRHALPGGRVEHEGDRGNAERQ